MRGISTTIGFCRDLIGSPAFAAAEFDTTYVDRLLEQNGRTGARSDESEEIAAIAAAMWEIGHRRSAHRRTGVDRSTVVQRRSTIDARRRTIDDRSGRGARGWNRCDERRRHRERPAMEGCARAGRAGGNVHGDDQGQEPAGRRVLDRRRHAVADRRRQRRARFGCIPRRRTARSASRSAARCTRPCRLEAKRRARARVRRVRQMRLARQVRQVRMPSRRPCRAASCACWSLSATRHGAPGASSSSKR